jgi:thiamine biosynthesis lipoprotein
VSGLASPRNAAEVFPRVSKSAQVTSERGLQKLSFTAMSTQCHVHFHGVSASIAQNFCRDVVAWVAAFEAKYSRFIPDSLIGRINSAAGENWVEIDSETERLLGFCNELVFFTRGSFDPTVLPIIRLWNWKTKPPIIPEESAISAARELVGWSKVQRRPGAIFLPRKGMCLDLGGIGKEYAVDCVMNLAGERGIRNVLVDFGQDVRGRGAAADKDHWRIGLEDANNPGKCWAGVKVTDHAVATSGDYLRSFEYQGRRYGHIVDPRTGYPVNNGCCAVSVIAPSCTIAGILTTSAMILGPKDGLQLIETHVNAEGAFTTDNNRVYSRRFGEYISG